MAKGSSQRSGPPPDPNALRRDRDSADWVTLPPEGRTEPAPDWPLTDPTDRELTFWTREWKRPQAVMWERNGQEAEVAMYVRSFATAESLEASTNARTLIRQQQEALGISLPGLARNRWKIGEPAETKARRRPRASASAKSRFRVLDGGAEAPS